jgi:hypothetical protein
MAILQKYLRDNLEKESLSQICKKFYIKCKKHATYPNLLLFKYANITVSFTSPCTREARGLILDSTNDWNIVSYPYDKFFNFGESNAATVDWNTAKIYEKLDGCLMTLYYYDDKWLISSSGKPDAGGTAAKDSSMTLGDVFWQVWASQGYALPVDTDLCYIFELLSDKNPVQVKYANNEIVLHGVRNVKTLKEIDPEIIAAQTGWKCIQIHNIDKNPESAVAFVNSRSGMDYEGIVVCDANFNRIKIKSHAYINIVYSLHAINRPEASRKKLFELIVSGNNNDLDELCATFPKLSEMAIELRDQINNLVMQIDNEYDIIKELGTQRRFAEEAKKSKICACLFMLRSKKAKSAIHCLAISGYDYFNKYINENGGDK